MENGIELRRISKSYRIPPVLPWKPHSITTALRDVSFTCPEAGITCILGPNGSGKTTIVKILAGLVTPDSGEAVIGGAVSSAQNPRLYCRVGLATSNERSFYWRLTGRQNLEFFSALHGASGGALKSEVGASLGLVGLEAEADKPVRQYSSGMRQRLLLARALLGDPKILLLDEPTTHLDHPGRKATHQMIRKNLVEERGLTVVVCTNDLGEAKDLADNLILLNKGSVLANGALSDLQSMLRTGWRLRITFLRQPGAGGGAGLFRGPVARDGDDWEWRISDLSEIPEIVDSTIKAGGRILGCSYAQPTLEEVFDRFVGESS